MGHVGTTAVALGALSLAGAEAGASVGSCSTHTAPLAGGGFHLVDLEHRLVRYVRISLTDRCNYRCVYCMPAEGVAVAPRADLLDFDEIERLARCFVAMGIDRIRLTGGEPLVRRGVVDVVARLGRIDGLVDLAMTTNGHLLADLAQPLRDAGLRRLNISIDTLDGDRFAALTRGGSLDAVLRGLEAADAAGFAATKINAVVVGDDGTTAGNVDQIAALASFCADRGYVLRLIEFMPIGLDARQSARTFVAASAMRATLQDAGWSLTVDESPSDVAGGGPARYWRGQHRDGGALRIGFITAVSDHFCATCNRVRINAVGTLRECLSTAGTLSLRDAMRAGVADDEIAVMVRNALLGKVDGHRFTAGVRTVESMSSIGG